MIRPEVYKIVQMPYTKRTNTKTSLDYHIIPYKNKYILYFIEKGILCYVNQSFIKKIKSDEPVVKELFKFLSKQKGVKFQSLHDQVYKYTTIILELTKACNLRCVYCYAHGGDRPKFMDWKTAKAGLDYQIKQHRKKKEDGKIFILEFHGGGEPTLAFPLMKKCYEYTKKKCDKYNIKLKCYCTTNGTLLTEDMVKWFKKSKIKIILSFDGTQDLQNKQRPFIDGTGSYNALKNSIALLNKYNIDYGTNTVITENVVEKMPEIVEELNKLHIKKNILISSMNFGRCLKNSTIGPKEKKFLKNFQKANKLAKKYNIRLGHNLDNFSLRLNALRKEACTGCGYLFSVTADGDITSCLLFANDISKKTENLFYGKIKDGKVIINDEKLKYLRDRNIDNMECKNCFAKYLCSGDCLLKCIRETQSIYKTPKLICENEKEKCKDFFIRLIEQPTLRGKLC